jgi:Transposase
MGVQTGGVHLTGQVVTKASRFSEVQKTFILKQGSAGAPVADICRMAGISQATCFNWKKRYDGLLPTEMWRLKQLEEEKRQAHEAGGGIVTRQGGAIGSAIRWRKSRAPSSTSIRFVACVNT